MAAEVASNASPENARRRWRLRVPIALVTLDALLFVAAWVGTEVWERVPVAEAQLAVLAGTALTIVGLVVWFVGFSPAPKRIRRLTGLLTVVVLGAMIALFRIDSVSGNVMPKLALRWSKKHDQLLPTLPHQAHTASTAVDLTKTTPHDWPQFLGPSRNATIDAIPLARDWISAPPKQLWRQPIGAGWASFAVVGDAAVTLEQRGDEELVTCYDVTTGKLLWSHADPIRFSATVGGIGPRSTPSIDEGRVYTMGAKGLVNCLAGADGSVVWQQQAMPEDKTPDWGKSCSPLILGELVIVSAGQKNGRSLIAYDKRSGNEVWSGGDDRSGYSSPTVCTLLSQEQILIVNQGSIAAHDPATGKIIWSHPWPTGSPNVSQPVCVGGERLFVSKGYGYGCQLWQLKTEPTGVDVSEIWQNRNLKTKFTNVVLRDNFVYGLDEGVLACLDLETGRRRWRDGRYGHGQIILVGDVILVQLESGEVALVEATPDAFHELTRFAALVDKTWNVPSLSGARLLVRNDTEAACYELPLAP